MLLKLQAKDQALGHEHTSSYLYRIAADLGLSINFGNPQGRYTRFTLRPAPGSRKYGVVRKNMNGGLRRVHAVCYHGHLDFMAHVYHDYPQTIIKSSLRGNTSYNGVDDFWVKAPDLEYVNIGSQMYPQYYGEACECER